ncbi:MAG: Crp/Fnr family transcriptional regulator, partial [Nitrospirae bacterium]|nr:Crp/Fnr family transcriptional regulator [Nitrospirota bacterium]
ADMGKEWYLEKIDILNELSKDELSQLTQNAIEKHYKTGDIIFMPDDPGNTAFLIKKGRVKLYNLSFCGKESILFLFYPGEFFGLSEIFGNERRVCFAEAEEHTTVTVIDSRKFEELLYKNQKISRVIIKILGTRLMQLCKTFEAISSQDLRARTSLALIKLGNICGVRNNGEILIETKITHKTLAAMVGSSRQGVTEMLNIFIKEKLIKYDEKKRIIILNRSKLIDSLTS